MCGERKPFRRANKALPGVKIKLEESKATGKPNRANAQEKVSRTVHNFNLYTTTELENRTPK
jgi:hypothetical protein